MRPHSYEIMRDENFPRRGLNTSNYERMKFRNQMLIDNPSLNDYIP